MITIRAGQFKNKKLQIPPTGVRPTSDKIRQAIFNILMHAEFAPPLYGARVLDAFAGTGAMGLEALSRGATHAWFMENDSAVQKILQQNLSITKIQTTLLNTDACTPPHAPEIMQIIFLDPPYGKNLLPSAITALHKTGWIDVETLLVIESDAEEVIVLPDDFTLLDEREYGRVMIRFARLRS